MSFSAFMLFWYVFPIVVLLACNYVVSSFSLTEKFKIKAPDIAIPFLFIGLHELSKNTYNHSLVPHIIISILLLGILVAVFQAYYYGEIIYSRYFKMFWRLIFLVVIAIYVAFVLLNIAHFFN